MIKDEHKQAIFAVIRQIPKGRVCTYGEIAKRASLPGYARYVGYLLKNLPEDSQLPWHRVINAQGMLSFPADSGKFREQKQRLLAEDVIFNNHKISLRAHIWQ